MKVGDIVYHKTKTEMPMVIYDLDDVGNIWCSFWNSLEFKKDCFNPKELLFDGEQQQKKADCGNVPRPGHFAGDPRKS